MKKLIAMVLTTLLATAGFAQTVDDHAKAKKGAIVGGIDGAMPGAVIGNILGVRGNLASIRSAAYSRRLSEQRANSATNYPEQLGVRGSRLAAGASGKAQARASTSTANWRQLNPRVEIHVRADA